MKYNARLALNYHWTALTDDSLKNIYHACVTEIASEIANTDWHKIDCDMLEADIFNEDGVWLYKIRTRQSCINPDMFFIEIFGQVVRIVLAQI